VGLPTDRVETGISAIIVNYNAGSLLVDCIARVLPQVDEVVVVDNGSEDDSLTLLERVIANPKHLKIIKNNNNLGFSVACNIGINNARSTNLLFLNPDCLIASRAVEGLLSALNSDPKIGMTGGLLLNEDGSEQAGGRRTVPTPWRSFVRAFGLSKFAYRWPRLFDDFVLQGQPLPQGPVDVEAISGACMLVKQEAVSDVGLWDENYFLHCEDLDWCMRFRQQGWRVLFVPNARIFHVNGFCSRNRKVFVEWHKHKGMILFYKKHFRHQYPGFLMWLVAVGVWLRFGLVVVRHGWRQLSRKEGLVSEGA
jgi:GT2 family glycosyltransferase